MTGKPARTAPRYAIYFAPSPDTAFGQVGWNWLGRDPWSDKGARSPPVCGLSSRRVAQLTAAPRLYGFHATLKPPFAVAKERSYAELVHAFDAFCTRQTAFYAPPLQVGDLGGFLALLPADRSARLDALAAACVRAFDGFRVPPGAAEFERHRAAGLSPRQDELLRRLGYPYVLEEFRFHMTLTGRLPRQERDRVRPVLAALFSEVCQSPVAIDGLCLFSQTRDGAPFLLRRQRIFGG